MPGANEMTPEAAQAVDALTRSVESLAQTIAAGRGSIYLAPGAALFGALIGVVGIRVLEYFRERRQMAKEGQLLAGALAAELRGFLVLWQEIERLGKPADTEGLIITWAVEQSYSSVFDGVGPRLFLLRRDLTAEVAAYYFRLKRALDNIRMSQGVTEYARRFGHETVGEIDRAASIGKAAVGAWEGAVESARRAVDAINKLLPKLDTIAGKDA